MIDEMMIDKLSAAQDTKMSLRSLGGMYDPADYREMGGLALDPDIFMAKMAQYSGSARVVTPDEWNILQVQLTDEEKAMMAYER